MLDTKETQAHSPLNDIENQEESPQKVKSAASRIATPAGSEKSIESSAPSIETSSLKNETQPSEKSFPPFSEKSGKSSSTNSKKKTSVASSLRSDASGKKSQKSEQSRSQKKTVSAKSSSSAGKSKASSTQKRKKDNVSASPPIAAPPKNFTSLEELKVFDKKLEAEEEEEEVPLKEDIGTKKAVVDTDDNVIPLTLIKRRGRPKKAAPLGTTTVQRVRELAPPIVIQIREFDPNIIYPRSLDPKETGSKIAIIGKPGSGKSYLMGSLIYTKKHIFPCAYISSGTEESNKFYQEKFPPLFIHDSLDISQLKSFIQRQRIVKDKLKNPWAMCIVDDCMDNPNIFRDPTIVGLFKNGRHWKMNFYLLMQYAVDILPVLRICIDYSFIFREPSLKNRKKIYENYASIIPSFELFNEIMDACTSDFSCLVINNRTTSNDFRECVSYYRAPAIPEDFRFGSEDYKKFHQKRYNEDYDKW